MKYLKIQNQGELDIRLVALMGGTTKIDNPFKIGQFGTGLKYAISWLVRNENKFKLFIGTEEIVFESRDEIIGDTSFKEIYCNDKSMSITTRYGYQWKAWEAIREIWCNAKDEGFEILEFEELKPIGESNKTTFFIEASEEITDVFEKWDTHFLNDTPIFENEKFAIYKNNSEKLRLYKNKVLIREDQYSKSLFIYDIKEATLNELRQYMGYNKWDIAKAILSSNKEVVDLFIQGWNKRSDCIEFKCEFHEVEYNAEHVKDIFSEYVYLHPESDHVSKEKYVRVPKELFSILEKCGLATEKVYKVRGRYYGSGGYGDYDDREITYKNVDNRRLTERIDKILETYDTTMRYSIVMPTETEFEIMITEEDGVMFNSDLWNSSPADLEAVVLIGILNNEDGNIFQVLKRLIKFAKTSKSFKKILFGTI